MIAYFLSFVNDQLFMGNTVLKHKKRPRVVFTTLGHFAPHAQVTIAIPF